MNPSFRYIRFFEELSIHDVPLVGGKNASLGEMYRQLAPQGVRIPNGFAVTAEGYRDFLEQTGLDQQIVDLLSDLDIEQVDNLRERGHKVRPTPNVSFHACCLGTFRLPVFFAVECSWPRPSRIQQVTSRSTRPPEHEATSRDPAARLQTDDSSPANK